MKGKVLKVSTRFFKVVSPNGNISIYYFESERDARAYARKKKWKMERGLYLPKNS